MREPNKVTAVAIPAPPPPPSDGRITLTMPRSHAETLRAIVRSITGSHDGPRGHADDIDDALRLSDVCVTNASFDGCVNFPSSVAGCFHDR